MALPIINLSVVPVFPSKVTGDGPTTIVKNGLEYVIGWDIETFSVNPSPGLNTVVLSRDPDSAETGLISIDGIATPSIDGRLSDIPTAIAGTNNSELITPQTAKASIVANAVGADYASRTVVSTITVPLERDTIRLSGFADPADGGGALCKRVATPGTPKLWHFQDLSGAWFAVQPGERGVNALALGAKRQAGFDSLAASQATIDYAVILGCDAYFPAGTYSISGFLSLPADEETNLVGDGKYSTLFQGLSGFSGYYIKHSKATPTGGAKSRVIGLGLIGPVSGTASGIEATNANTAVYEDLYYGDLALGIGLTDSFATHHVNCIGVGFGSHWLYSSTKAHDSIVDRCHIFNSTGPAIRVDGATDVFAITNSDFEYCGSVLQMEDISGLSMSGVYIEGCTNVEFYFPTMCRGFDANNVQIALKGAVPGSGTGSQVTSTYDNIQGGQFNGITLFEQHIAWGSNVDGIDIGPVKKRDANPARSSMAAPPWHDFASYANGWSASGTRPSECRRNSRNEILLRGRLIAGTPNTTACVLPTGYEPVRQGRYFVPMEDGNGCLLTIDTNGNVVPAAAGGGAVDIDGVFYPAASS